MTNQESYSCCWAKKKCFPLLSDLRFLCNCVLYLYLTKAWKQYLRLPQLWAHHLPSPARCRQFTNIWLDRREMQWYASSRRVGCHVSPEQTVSLLEESNNSRVPQLAMEGIFFKETLARLWHLSLKSKLKQRIIERVIRIAVSLDLDNCNVRASGLLSKEKHLCLLIMKYGAAFGGFHAILEETTAVC